MPRSAGLSSAVLLTVLALPLVGGGPVRAAVPATGPLPVNGLGVSCPAAWLEDAPESEAPGERLRLPRDWHSPGPGAPLYVRAVVGAETLRRPGRLLALLEELRRRELIPVLVLDPPAGDPGAGRVAFPDFDVEDWLEDLDHLLSSHPVHPLLVEVLHRPSERVTPQLYAYLVKRTATAIRAVNPRALIATGPLRDLRDLPVLRDLGIGPYVDAIALDTRLEMDPAIAATRRAFPGMRLWLDGAGQRGQSAIQQAGQAFSEAVSLVLAAPGAGPGPDELTAWRRLFSPGAAVIPRDFTRVTVLDRDGAPMPSREMVELEAGGQRGRFVVLFEDSARGPVELRIRGPRVGVAWLQDLVAGEEIIGGTASWEVAPGADPETARTGTSRVRLNLAGGPVVVRLGRHGPGQPMVAVEEVRGSRELTVEEIVARHRQAQAAQDRKLQTLMADVRIDYHFRVANLNQTFDVTTTNRYFQDGATAVYEEQAIYINGAIWRGRKPPDLPFILPERVTEVPLDLRLDQRYTYRLEGREEVEGRPAYVVAFTPLPTDEKVYRGKVWIDAQEFTKLKMDAVELNIALPVISNHITQEFSPLEIDGSTWWLRTGVRGQMVFTALGRNVVLERELDFSDIEINAPRFTDAREEVFTSPHEVLRETPEGFERLKKVKDDEGNWVATQPRPGDIGVSRLLVAGWAVNDDLEPGIPFVGINYFNYDFRGTGNQFNVAWAGPFLNVFWSDPSLANTRTILALETRLNPLGRNNRRIEEGDGKIGDITAERLEVSSQQVSATVAYPVAVYHTFQTVAGLDYLRFEREDETASSFVLPNDTVEASLTLNWVYAQAGWRLDLGAQGALRTDWEFWGKPDGSDYDPDDDRFFRSSLILNKTIYPRPLDRLGFRLAVFDGTNLDRFSKFELGEFGAGRINGYGSGIRFDRGAFLDLNYGVSLKRQVQLDFTVSHGRFENEEDYGPDPHWATGASVAAGFSGPWNSYFRVRVAGGLGTSLEDPEGSVGLRVIMFRTFSRWFWQKKDPKGT